MANDLLTAVVLATRAPVLLAPAMNVNMWKNPVTQANLARLLGPGGRRARLDGRPRPRRAGLRLDRRGAADRAGGDRRRGGAACWRRRRGDLARAPGRGDRRADARAGRRRALPRQPIVGEDGRGAGGGGGRRAAPTVTLVAGPGTPAGGAAARARIDFETAADLERALADRSRRAPTWS